MEVSNLYLVRRIGNKDRIALPKDITSQMNLKEGDAITIDIQNINGIPTITINKYMGGT